MASESSALRASPDTLLKYALALGDFRHVYILSPDAMAALGEDLAIVERIGAADRIMGYDGGIQECLQFFDHNTHSCRRIAPMPRCGRAC